MINHFKLCRLYFVQLSLHAGLIKSIEATSYSINLAADATEPIATFIINQFVVQAGIAPNISDPNSKWNNGCKLSIANCSASQIEILQSENRMVKGIEGFNTKRQNGLFLNLCFIHCQLDSQDTWLSEKSPLIDNMV
ncbi:hypothetical protein LIER_34891 [Lithospermum erythrorhizon]|uniref:Pectin acetylesterase n=1 Tax=Lithospermum erythrorhizon TaxID=34254 RepID=A0AAV3S0Z3_LITER